MKKTKSHRFPHKEIEDKSNSLQALLTLLESAGMLSLSTALIKTLPFGQVRRFLGRDVTRGEHDWNASASSDVEEFRQAKQVQWGIDHLQRYLPWHCSCLSQAIAGQWMMRRRGLSSQLYVGVDPTTRPRQFHAWLRHDDEILIGAFASKHMKVLFSHTYHAGEGCRKRRCPND